MNVERLLQVKAAILAEPSSFDMYDFFCETECGSAGCIAGHATALVIGQSLHDCRLRRMAGLPLETATKFLELDGDQANRLFYMEMHKLHIGDERWPAKFDDAYVAATTSEEKAKVAAGRIDHFIATEGKE